MKTKGIFAIVAVLLILVVATAGCVDNTQSIEDEIIFIDPANGVMYGVYWAGIGIGFFDLVNSDGTPKVITNNAKYFSNKDLNVYYISNNLYDNTHLRTKCYVDDDTGVMYLLVLDSKAFTERFIVTVMLNSDGTVKTINDSYYYDVISIQEEVNANMFVDEETKVVYLSLHGAILPMHDSSGNYKVAS